MTVWNPRAKVDLGYLQENGPGFDVALSGDEQDNDVCPFRFCTAFDSKTTVGKEVSIDSIGYLDWKVGKDSHGSDCGEGDTSCGEPKDRYVHEEALIARFIIGIAVREDSGQ